MPERTRFSCSDLGFRAIADQALSPIGSRPIRTPWSDFLIGITW